MEITEALLRANGWQTVFFYTFCSSYLKTVNLRTDIEIVFYVADDPTIRLRMGTKRVELPNVTSMEQLSQLEFYLSEYRIVDTAPMDEAIRAQFERPSGKRGEGG